jgi:multiple sugar transport system substrate-binding protein
LSRLGIAGALANTLAGKPLQVSGQGAAPPELRMVLATIPIPGANDFTAQLAQSWGNQNGVSVTIDFERLRDLPPRVDRILRGAEQRDIVELQELEPYRHTDQLLDLTSMIDSLMSDQGGYAEWASRTVRVRRQWFSVPIGTRSLAVTYRPSLLQAAGIDDPATQFPTTWDDYFALAARLKQESGPPAGQALAQTPFIAPAFCNAYMWAAGGSEITPDSRALGFNSPEMTDALQKFATAWTDGFDPGGTNWDDDSNSSAFLAGKIAMTLSGAEIYQQARLGPVPGIADDIAIAPVPAGPAGRFIPLGSRSLGISSRTPNPEMATAFLNWWCSLGQYSQWMIAQQGTLVPPGPALLEAPVFTSDPAFRPFIDALDHGRTIGYSAAPSRASADVAANYFVVNTFADVARGVDVPTALDRGQRLMERFYKQQPGPRG